MKEQNRLCSDEILFLKIGHRQESVHGPVRQPPDKGQEGGAGAGGPSVACEVERRASVTQKRETRDVWGDGCSDPDWWGSHRSTCVLKSTDVPSKQKPTVPCINLTDTFRTCTKKPNAGRGRAVGWPRVTNGHSYVPMRQTAARGALWAEEGPRKMTAGSVHRHL